MGESIRNYHSAKVGVWVVGGGGGGTRDYNGSTIRINTRSSSLFLFPFSTSSVLSSLSLPVLFPVSFSFPFGNAILTWFYFLFPALLYLSILFTTLLYLFDSLSPPYCHSYPPHLSFPTLAHSLVLKIAV